ncbi:MAG TPA: chitobiase/beta-hexosaminidase C-terminal domain-containing protein, partial [Candidatus Wallbacteria bacterium]|nr:chitobiase/beta-hexosaminidase C-terminal domain-containing protein [Candidatus Wallbacteria bacterium]
MLDSDAASETYTNVNTAAIPVFSLNGGEYNATQSVALTSKTEGASIYYTLNGSLPSVANGTLYGGTIEVSSSVTIKAIAVKQGMRDSQVATAEYTITIPELPQVSAPEFKPAAAAYNSTREIEISCATPGATIYYTIDETVPSKNSIKYSGPVEIAKSVTIKAIAIKAGMKDSLAAEVKYVIVFPVSPPVFKPVGSSVYTSTQEVELICATPGATIYYTVDGGVPTKAGLKYENPVTVSKTTTIKAFAVKDGMADSEISEARYPIRFPVAEPAFSFAGGTYETTLEVTITTSTEGARIYYTLDGTTPSAANGTLYSSPLQITRPLDIKAVAVKDEMGDSAVIAAAYVVPTETVSAPAISPNGGFFFSQTQVTITCATSDAEIYYTLDGTAPSKLSAKYASPLMINKFGKFSVKAVAYKSGMFDSPVSESADFTIAVPPLPQADLTKVTIDKMQSENKMCLKNVTTSMEYSIDATGPTAGVTWKTGTGADIPLEFPGAPELGAPKANAPSYGGGADTSPYIVVRDKNYTNRLRGLGRYNSLPLSNSSSSDHSWSLDALSAKIVHGKPNYGNSADFKLYLYVGTTASNGTPVGGGYQLGDVASGNRTSIPIPSSDKASWTAADYFSFYLKNTNNTADDTSDDYYYAICTPVKVSAGPDMANNTAAALVNAADGGAYAPAGIANIDGGDKGVTLRPGLSLSANES